VHKYLHFGVIFIFEVKSVHKYLHFGVIFIFDPGVEDQQFR